jgi:hypothetical protein
VAEEITPGTPETPAPGDAEATVQAGEVRDGGEDSPDGKRTDWKALYLSSKDKVERVNTLEDENRQLKDERARAAATDSRVPSTQEQADLQQVQADLAKLREAAQYDSLEGAQARIALKQAEYVERSLLRVVANQQFDRIKDDELREETEKQWRSGEYATPDAARRAAKGVLAEKREKATGDKESDVAKREAALKAEREAREAGRVDTVTRGVAVSEAKKKMTTEDYISKVAVARSAKNWDEVKRLNQLELAGHVLPPA